MDSHENLNDYRSNNNNLIIEQHSIEDEFKFSLLRDQKLFLCEKYRNSNVDNNLLYYICSCGEIICDACSNFCHKFCTAKLNNQDYEKNINKLNSNNPNNMVSEYFSSCECTHSKQEEADSNVLENGQKDEEIPCFFSFFLTDYLSISEVFYKLLNPLDSANPTEICNFCHLFCCENKRSFQKSKEKVSSFSFNKCKCQKKRSKMHSFDKIFDFIQNCFKQKYQSDVVFEEMNVKFRIEFTKFFHFSKQLQESIMNKFAMYIIMYKDNLKINFMHEKILFDTAIEKLKEKNIYFFFSEKKNIALSYIFYYYRKYFFNKMKMVTGKNINMLSLEQRINISVMNSNIEISEHIFGILMPEFLNIIFSVLISLRNYSIKISDEEPQVPFILYFLKLFFQVYFYDYGYLSNLFQIINDIKYKQNFENHNYQISKNIDEIYYLFKIHEIDKFLARKVEISSKDFLESIRKNDSPLIKIFNFGISDGDNFRSYLNIIFKNELKFNPESISKERLVKMINNDDLIYLDCFHNKFIVQTYNFIIQKKTIKIENVNKDFNNFKKIKSDTKNLYKNVLSDETKGQSESTILLTKLDNVLSNLGLLNLSSIENHDEFLNYLYYRLKHHYYEKKYLRSKIKDLPKDVQKKIKSNYYFKIDIRNFWGNQTSLMDYIDVNKIIANHSMKEKIENIFSSVFSQEFYKKNEFRDVKFKFNLVLFGLVANRPNIIFLISELRFFEYLLEIKRTTDGKNIKKSFLIRSLFKTKPSILDYDFIWKCFYLIFRYVVEFEEEFNFLKSIIVKYFINEIIEFYMIRHGNFKIKNKINPKEIKENELKLSTNMNTPLIYFFLKLFKRLLIKSNFNSIFPLDYNVNNYSLIDNVIHLIEVAFSIKLNLEEYFKSFQIIENPYNTREKIDNLINNEIKKMRQNNIKIKSNDEEERLLDEKTQSFLDNENKPIFELNDETEEVPDTMIDKISINHIQVCILDILGYMNIRSRIDLDLKYLNNMVENYSGISDFLTKTKPKWESGYNFFKLEKILVKYLCNLTKIKIEDFSEINYIKDSDLTNTELIELGFKKTSIDITLRIDDIDFQNYPLISKYILNKVKIKIIDILIKYLEKKNSSNFNKSSSNMNKAILIYFTFLMKEFLLKKKEGIIVNLYFEEKFDQMIRLFEKFLDKTYMVERVNINKYEGDIDDLKILRKLLYKRIYIKIIQIFKEEHKKINKYKKIYGSECLVYKYFRKYIFSETKKGNINTEIILNLCSAKINFENLSDESRSIKTKLDFGQELSKVYWGSINSQFINGKDNLKIDVLDKIVSNLIYHLNIINYIDEQEMINNFELIFNENFLKTVNFINNILYYYPEKIKKTIKSSIEENQIKPILINIIKLNNFIINHVEYEYFDKIFSISSIYFVMMDFIILLDEGDHKGPLNDLFFKDLSYSHNLKKNEEHKACDHQYEKIEDFLNNSTELEDKLNDFVDQLEKCDNYRFYDLLPKILDSFKNEFFNNTDPKEPYDDLEKLQNQYENLFYNIQAASYILEKIISILNFNDFYYNNFNEDDFIDKNPIFDNNKIKICQLLAEKIFDLEVRLNKEKCLEIGIIITQKSDLSYFKELFKIYQNFHFYFSLFMKNLIEKIKLSNKNDFLNYLKNNYRIYNAILADYNDTYIKPHNLPNFIKVICNCIENLQEIKRKEEKNVIDNKIKTKINNKSNTIENNVINEKEVKFKEEVHNKSLIQCNNQLEKRAINENDIFKMESSNQKYNFYFFNFYQMAKIINLMTSFSFVNYCCGSDKLIIQFLYISRFLKENVEVKDLNTKKDIILNSFNQLFKTKWLFLKKYLKYELSFIIKTKVLRLLIAYLEEFQNVLNGDDFFHKIQREIELYDVIDAIIDCFEKCLPEDLKNENVDINELLFYYIKDEANIFNKKEFELIELYYKLLRYVKTLFEEFINEFKPDILESDDRDEYKNYFQNSSTSIIGNGKTSLNKDNRSDEKFKHTRKKYLLYLKLILQIGKEVEIKYENDDYISSRSKIYFIKSPKCFWMTNTVKEYLNQEAPRSSLGAKLDFLNKNLDLFLLNICVSYKEKFNDSRMIALFYKNFNVQYLNTINFFFVLMANIMLLNYFYFESETLKETDLNSQMLIFQQTTSFDEFRLTSQKYNYIFFQTLFSCFIQSILVFIWYKFRFEIFYWLQYYTEDINNFFIITKNIDEKFLKENYFIKNLEMKEKYSEEKTYLNSENHNFLTRLRIGSRALFFNDQMISITICFIFNLIYLITNMKIFLILQILAVINLYSLFEYFVKAIFNKSKQFISLLIFIYCVNYIFSWISFLHLQEFMISNYNKLNTDLNQNAQKELICSTAIECFLNYIHLGLRLGGGIGDSLPRISYKFDNKINYYSKILFDVFFHIIINLILANIFFGVIVDAFNEMRDENDEKEDDLNNKCFICNLDRYQGSKREDFDFHRNVTHYTLNYIFIIPYLLKINPQQYSKAEQFIWDKINLYKIDWLPSENNK